MFCRSLCRRHGMDGIRAGRAALQEQFGSMEGWQSGQDPRFDEFVAKQRLKESFEAFDQRVERAFRQASRLHRAEIVNGFKRNWKSSGNKASTEGLREMQQAVEARMEWLRDVWGQIDADYRSNDQARQDRAASEISKAIAGEPSDYMAWAYERKFHRRFMGEKGKADTDAATEDEGLPEMTDDEANRYMNLKTNMLEVERNVKTAFGVAGARHWSDLQRAKDEEYEAKLDVAVAKYQELLDQQNRMEESRSTTHVRNAMQRTHEARVRFQAAMEMEKEREGLVEAHEAMKKERREEAAERRRAMLQEAAALRAEGKNTEEITKLIKQRTMEEQLTSQAAYRQEEQQMIQKKKDTFLAMIEKIRLGAEYRDGEELLSPQQQQAAHGFMEEDASASPPPLAQRASSSTRRRTAPTSLKESNNTTPAFTESELSYLQDAQEIASLQRGGRNVPSSSSSTTSLTRPSVPKEQLWSAINQDRHADPFLAVHQARLDADKYYDTNYQKMLPDLLVMGKRDQKRGMGEYVAGNEGEKHILQSANKTYEAYQWATPHGTVHNLDGDGEREYFLSDVFHVRDKKTGDVDWTQERRGGGPMWKGPRFYKFGEERAAKDPTNWPVDGPRQPSQVRSATKQQQQQPSSQRQRRHGGK